MSFVNIQDRKLPFALRYLADLMAYRHLCWNLVGSDTRSRFRGSRLGLLWAIIQPLGFAMAIAAVWGALARQVSYLEFALYVLSGQVAFELFGTAIAGGQGAITHAGGFVRQARIPLFIFQLRVALTALIFFMLSLASVFIFQLATGQAPTVGLNLLLVPAFMGVALLFMLPIIIIMSLIGAMYRDVRHISSLFERVVFLLSPVMLPREILHQPQLQFLEYVNPIVPFLDLFRDPVIYGKLWEVQDVLVMSIWIAGLWAMAIITATSIGRKVVFSI